MALVRQAVVDKNSRVECTSNAWSVRLAGRALPSSTLVPGFRHMRKLWLALLFLSGGAAHELRNPTNCHCVPASYALSTRKRAGQ